MRVSAFSVMNFQVMLLYRSFNSVHGIFFWPTFLEPNILTTVFAREFKYFLDKVYFEYLEVQGMYFPDKGLIFGGLCSDTTCSSASKTLRELFSLV